MANTIFVLCEQKMAITVMVFYEHNICEELLHKKLCYAFESVNRMLAMFIEADEV